jgi:hypothetical protein
MLLTTDRRDGSGRRAGARDAGEGDRGGVRLGRLAALVLGQLRDVHAPHLRLHRAILLDLVGLVAKEYALDHARLDALGAPPMSPPRSRRRRAERTSRGRQGGRRRSCATLGFVRAGFCVVEESEAALGHKRR